MSSTTIDLLAPLHRLTVDQYMEMGRLGLLAEELRVELIDGVVVEMSPAAPPHRLAVMFLNRGIVPQLAGDAIVSPQQGVPLPALQSMPEPDIALLPLDARGAPTAAPPLLVIEVSASSLRYDRITKARLYARAGVGDYWIVNVGDETAEVHREPSEDAYASRTVHRAGETLRPLELPGVAVELAPLFDFAAGRLSG